MKHKTHNEFNSISDYVKYLDQTPISKHFKGKELSSVTGDHSFTETWNYEDAQDKLKYGWNEGFDEFVKAKKQVESIMTDYIVAKPKPINSVVGHVPNVARYIQGHPLNMIEYKKQEVKQPIIDIYNGITYSAFVETSEIIRKGVILLSVIDAIEKAGYRVNLYNIFYADSPNDNEVLSMKVKLKDATQPLNVKKLYYPLVNPSFLRRQTFRYIEVAKTKYSYRSGYGRPVGQKRIKKELADRVYYFGQIKELGIKTFDIKDDINAVLSKTGLDDIINVKA